MKWKENFDQDSRQPSCVLPLTATAAQSSRFQVLSLRRFRKLAGGLEMLDNDVAEA